jgi:hypothetical protein
MAHIDDRHGRRRGNGQSLVSSRVEAAPQKCVLKKWLYLFIGKKIIVFFKFILFCRKHFIFQILVVVFFIFTQVVHTNDCVIHCVQVFNVKTGLLKMAMETAGQQLNPCEL